MPAGPLLPAPRRADLDWSTPVREVPGGRRIAGDHSLPPQGYRMQIGESGRVDVAAHDGAGLFYAEATLTQLRRLAGDAGLPTGEIEDWPDLLVRGVMLDVSRCRVPTVETLCALVDRLAALKVNHLELYMEHTFAYARHQEVWRDAGAFTRTDLQHLRAYCAARHVELTANQNCLGHMERWLVHRRYAPLGVIRGVGRGPLGMPVPASTLDPAKAGSLALVDELLTTLCAALPGHRLHVGLDEPWDLPAERIGEWRTWLDALRGLRSTAGRELLVWGDVPALHPELAAGLGDDIVVCEWGYEANHPFEARLSALADAGLRRWVCPGTSSWLSVLGRASNAVDGCRAAADAAGGGGAEALLVTDWGDFGHLQHLPVSDPGLAAAAAFAWCSAANRHLDAAAIGEALDVHVYGDEAGLLGSTLVRLGDLHTLVPTQVPNVSSLVLHLYFPQLPVGRGLHDDLELRHLDEAEGVLAESLDALGRAKPSNSHGTLAVRELRASIGLMQLAVRDMRARLGAGATLASVPTDERAALADALGPVIESHRAAWLGRNRPAGLDESCAWLEHLGRCYRSGGADDDWAGPLVARIRARDAGGT
jgi:hypothetical protein